MGPSDDKDDSDDTAEEYYTKFPVMVIEKCQVDDRCQGGLNMHSDSKKKKKKVKSAPRPRDWSEE